MQLLSINLGRARTLEIGPRQVRTGIYKTPVERAEVQPLGLLGDVVADTQHHGGPDQAVYLYSADDYAWWAAQLGWALEPGTFGENLTFSTFGTAPVRIGDRYQVGEVLLEVTAPRIPCAVLAAHMDDTGFVKTFRQARLPGCYARVIEAGTVYRGDSVQHFPAPLPYPTVVEAFDLWYQSSFDPAVLRWFLVAPLAQRYRQRLEELLP